jgi:hypothetical protein
VAPVTHDRGNPGEDRRLQDVQGRLPGVLPRECRAATWATFKDWPHGQMRVASSPGKIMSINQIDEGIHTYTGARRQFVFVASAPGTYADRTTGPRKDESPKG